MMEKSDDLCLEERINRREFLINTGIFLGSGLMCVLGCDSSSSGSSKSEVIESSGYKKSNGEAELIGEVNKLIESGDERIYVRHVAGTTAETLANVRHSLKFEDEFVVRLNPNYLENHPRIRALRDGGIKEDSVLFIQ